MGKKADIKLPKRVAGIKIPKAVRKGPIAKFLNTSGGQVLLAEGLLMAAAVYAARRIDPEVSTGDVLRHPIDSLNMRRASHGNREASLGAASERLARAFRAGMSAFRGALQDGGSDMILTPDQAQATAATLEPETEAARKKSSRNEAARRESAESARRDLSSGAH
jgi:hypothetical protein